jgi:hypothetical protein
MAGERHERGMLCVNPPLGKGERLFFLLAVKHSLQQRVLNNIRASKDVHNKDQPLKHGE